MEKKLKERSLDIRSELFAPLLDEMQNQLIDCLHAIETGVVDSGRITASLDVNIESEMRDVVCDAGNGIESKLLEYKKPVFEYSTKLALKKEDSQKGTLEEDGAELVCANDRWVLRELARQQMSIDDIEQTEDDMPEDGDDEQQ